MKKLILILAVLLTSIAFAQNVPPAIFYSDITSGPNTGGVNNAGAFVTIHGNGFGATQGSSTVTVGGGAAASYQSWSNTAVTFQLGASAKTGSIVISAGGATSNSVPFTVRSGKIYFVSTSGSDTSAGSYSSPWKTLAHAASVMTAGSITYVENGYTQSTELVLGRGGSTSSPLAILGYPGSSVTVGATTGLTTGVSITASNWVLANLILRGTQTALSVGNVTGIRLAGSDISCPNVTATGGCISTSGGSSFALLGNSIHNNASYQAVSLLNTNGVEIGWNLITNTLGCNAIGAHSSSALQYSYKVHDNYIYKTTCGAIALGTVNPSLGAVSVYNNIIQSSGTGPAPAGTSQSYGYAAIMIGGGSSTPAQVYNNTIYDAGGLGGESAGAVRALGAVNLTNNIFYLLSSEQYVSLDTTLSYLTGSNNLFYGAGSPLGIFSDSVAGDPIFAGMAANNFHLSAGSPAIDSGATVQLATDYDGVPRPQGPAYDIGAYEYPEASGAVSATPVSTTATPTSTSATPTATSATPASATATPAATAAWGGVHSSKTPAVGLSHTSLTFASQTVGTTSAAQTVTLKNTGTAALTISKIAASSSFAETNTCATSLAASASCTISVTFTPTAAGTPTGSISITDNAAGSLQAVSLSGTAVAAASTLTITTTSLPSGVVGTAYSTTLAATGGTAPYTWTDPSCSGSCNTGMSFSTAGVLSGTPANAGTSTFTMTVADSAGHTATKQLSITIAAAAASTPAVSLSPASLTFASQTVGTTSAAQTVTLKNTGAGALSISSVAASGNFAETTACPSSLPAGASCTISVTFTPTAAGTPTGSISITDNAAASPQAVSLSGTAVAAASTLTITSTSLPAGTVGTAYSATLAATGGTAPYTWTDPSCSGSCNTGMAFSSAGVLSGTPVNAGTSTFTFTVTDSASHTASAQLSITIAAAATASSTLAITTASLPAGTVGTAYSTTLAATGGTAPYTWTDPSCSGACNTGMTFTSAGVFSGTPANAGTSTFTFTVTDSAGNTASAQLSITLAAAATGSSGSGAPSVALSWTASSGTVNGYDVYRSSQSGTGYSLVNSGLVSGSSYTDTSVSAGQTYYYVVTSVNSSGVQSSYSSQVTATVPAS